MSDKELEEIRKRKLLELQRQLYEAEREEIARQQYEMQKDAILRQLLTADARSRLTNLKMVKPELAEQIELQLINLAQAGRIRSPLTDDQLKALLKKLIGKRREPKIIFK
ncbi:MAG: DNA-binding protein [Candidatus Asgardarchaeia archaeon]